MEKRTYEISGLPEHLNELERLFKYIGVCGEIGTSQDFSLFVDGDGRAYLTFKRNDTDERLDDPDCTIEEAMLEDEDSLKFSLT